MITFSNKTNNGEFNYSNENVGIYVNGNYVLSEDNVLITIHCRFGYDDKELNSGFDAYNVNGETMNYTFSCQDFELAEKMMSVYDNIVEEIKKNYTEI